MHLNANPGQSLHSVLSVVIWKHAKGHITEIKWRQYYVPPNGHILVHQEINYKRGFCLATQKAFAICS